MGNGDAARCQRNAYHRTTQCRQFRFAACRAVAANFCRKQMRCFTAIDRVEIRCAVRLHTDQRALTTHEVVLDNEAVPAINGDP